MVDYLKKFTKHETTIVSVVNRKYGFTSRSETTQESNTVSVNLTSSKFGGELPTYRDLIRAHQDATTNFVGTRRFVYMSGIGSWSVTLSEADKPSAGYDRFTDISGYGILPFNTSFVTATSQPLEIARQIAKTKFLLKVKEARQKLAGGTVLGEMRQTLHMIRHPAQGLFSYLMGEQLIKHNKRMRKAAKRRGRPVTSRELKRNRTKAVADTWLEVQYGIRPFLSDVQGAMDAYDQIVWKIDNTYVTIRGKGKAEAQSGPTGTGTGGSGYVRWDTTVHAITKAKAMIYGEVEVKSGGSRSRWALQSLGLTVEEFVPTLWEVLPFSFLADYWSNIGDVLNTAFVDLGGLRRRSTVYQLDGIRTTSFDIYGLPQLNPLNHIGGGGGHPKVDLINRTVSRSLGADLSAPSVRFEFPVKALHWANMGALVAAAYGGSVLRR